MKPILPLIAGAAVVAAVMSIWSPAAEAQQPKATVTEDKIAYPVGRRCEVTLDPQDPATIQRGIANGEEHQVVGNKVEGDLVSVNNGWVVLKDGNYENWVPVNKVLHIRVSR